MKNKKCLLLMLVALAACSSPFTPDEKETGEFTISINANTSRAVAYPPSTADIAALKFVFHFTPQGSGTAKDFTVEKSSTTKGKVDAGHYKVTMDVYDLEDTTILYARGVADNNPVEIKAGVTTTINIDAYNAANAEPPVISVQPQDATTHVGATATPLTVAATVTDGGTLSYQWHSNTTASATGWSNVGTNSPSFTLPTATAGTTYYYVEVTNTSTGSATKITCGPAAVVVNPVYTVTFNKNNTTTGSTDASPATKSVIYPATHIDALPTPSTRTPFTFEGWNTQADGKGTVFTASTPVTANITVYAQWALYVPRDATWADACTAISGGGNNQSYTINITGDFDTAGVTAATFGNVTGLNVTITGDYTISLTGTGSLLRPGVNQTVVIRDTDFVGNSGNNTALIYLNGPNANLTMEGNSSVSGNTSYSQGGGVFMNSGTFNMTGGTISGNTAGNYGGGGVHISSSGIFQIEKGTIYGTDNPGLANTATGSGTRATLNNNGTAQLGTFSVPGDPTSTWTSNGDLVTRNETINVVDGVEVP